MSPKALQLAAGGLGCIGLLCLAIGGAVLVGGSLGKVPKLGGLGGHRPSEEIVEQCIRERWEKQGDGFNPRSTVEIHEIQIGDTYPANEQDVIDGVPPGGDVTTAYVDWTVTDHYMTSTTATRRRRDHHVYVDKLGRWAAAIHAARGEDETSHGPASP